MPDLLVKLYGLNFDGHRKEYFDADIKIVRALTPDKTKVLEFVRKEFNENWANECERSFSKVPVSCFIAVRDQKMMGFACYDVTARGYFGPMGVHARERRRGVGTRLLFSCLIDMWDVEYGYAVIGGVADDAIDFYKKAASATVIPGSNPGIYKRMVEAS